MNKSRDQSNCPLMGGSLTLLHLIQVCGAEQEYFLSGLKTLLIAVTDLLFSRRPFLVAPAAKGRQVWWLINFGAIPHAARSSVSMQDFEDQL